MNTRGLEGNTATKKWGTIVKHPILPQWAVGIEEHDVNCFLEKQTPTVLVPVLRAEMLLAGWLL